MGKKTHGPILVAAIEHNDYDKVREVLLTHIKTKARIQALCISEVRRLASEYTEIPILLAATLPNPAIIKFLVADQDVNLNFVHKETYKRKTKVKTALINAVRMGLVSTTECILAMNADPNIQDHKGRTALHHAVRKADYRTAKMLLSRGAKPNVTDIAGNTPLHTSTIFGHLELVKLLIRHEADMFKKGTGGAIPMHMAAKEGHSALIELFCQYGVNVNMKVPCYDKREKAPIHVAAEEGHAETILVLLDKCGADPNLRDSQGETPLHCACLREYDPMGMKSKDDYTETTKVILQYGAHIDLQNSRGETPLHLAARNEFQKTVEVLIQAGSDPTIEDHAGYKPYDLATADDTVTVQILKSAMEERDQIMSDAMELQAKGYSTSLMKQSLSRSGLNMNTMASSEFNAANSIYEDGYLQPVGFRSRQNNFVGSGSSQDLLGKSRSTSSSGSKPSMNQANKQRKTGSKSSLHNLDQSADTDRNILRNRNQGRTLPNPPPGGKHESKNTEVSSFWDITPRTSTSTVQAPESPVNKTIHEINKSYESLPLDDVPSSQVGRTKPRGRRAPKTAPKSQNTIQIMAAFPNANKIPGAQPRADTTDDDSFFDDESFDTLDTLSEKNAPAVPPKPTRPEVPLTPEEQRKIISAVSNLSLHSWLDEQADILKKDGSMPHPPSTVSHRQGDTYSTASEISSVSKARKKGKQVPQLRTFENKQQPSKPPPLPPKPAPRKPQQAVQPIQSGQTVIKFVPAEAEKHDSVSEMSGTTYTEDTVVYKQHERLDSKFTTDDSISVATESTVKKSPRKKNRTKKSSNIPEQARHDSEEQSSTVLTTEDDTGDWENAPMSLHARNIARSIQARNNSKQSELNQQKANRREKRRSADMDDDTSNSLSWGSSEEESVVSTQKRPGVKFDNSPHVQNVQRGHPIDPALNTSLADEYRFYKSVGDLQSASSTQIQSRMQRKYSEGDLLSNTNSSPQQMNQRGRQPYNRNKSFDLSEMRSGTIDEDVADDAFAGSEFSSGTATQRNNGNVRTPDCKVIHCDASVCHQLKLAGGNETGVFIQALGKVPTARKLGLEVGDQIVTIHKQPIKTFTKEDVGKILKDVKISAPLGIKKNPTGYGVVTDNKGAGDLFHIRTHFRFDAGTKSELSFTEGDVLTVQDTLPAGKPGMWYVVKVNAKPDQLKQGLIPNEDKAQQMATSAKIALLRAEEIKQKKGVIRKGFARAKSLDRSMNKNETEEFRNAIKDVVAYERVISKPSEYKRPVVLLGLFCDSVREVLIQDLPQYFDKPAGVIELVPSEAGDSPPVDIRPIQTVMNRDTHCVVILSPASVKYVQEQTDLNAVVIYLCPQNKAMVKSLKQRFAPGFDRKPGFMYDEAIHFSKQHGHMFTEIVKYTSDGGWLSTLKDTIAKLQNEPTWHPDVGDDDDEANLDDSDEWDDEQSSQVQQMPVRTAQPRPSREQVQQVTQPRVSKTTDDIPSEIQNVLTQHVLTGAMRPSAKSQSMGDALNEQAFLSGTYLQDAETYDNSPRSRPRQRTNRQPITDSYDNNNSSGSSEKKLTKSILKNKSHSSLSDDLSGELDSFSTSSSGHRTTSSGHRTQQYTAQQYNAQEQYNVHEQYSGNYAQQQHVQRRAPQQYGQQRQVPQQYSKQQQQQRYAPQTGQKVKGFTTML